MAILIATGICLIFGYIFHMTIDTFHKDELIMKIIGCIISIMILGFMVIFVIAHQEDVQMQTMNDYFEGKVEVIEQIDTVRTFKFN